jgi:hypothetical protein
MRYIRVKWIHTLPDEPTLLYSEVDDGGWERRKVEIYPDGTAGYAGPGESFGSTLLGEVPFPPLDEIAADPQFEPCEISRGEFEQVWSNRLLEQTGRKGS